MKLPKSISKRVSGTCVIFAILSVSGCATGHHSSKMHASDVEQLVIDCSMKDHQLRLLQSLRSTKDDRLMAFITNSLQPWRLWAGDEQHFHDQEIKTGRYDWMIDQKILRLKQNCL